MSFSNAGLGDLHALAHALGGVCDILHGWVHPTLLPSVMRYNLASCMAKMGEIGRLITGSNAGSDREAALMGIRRLEQLFEELKLNTKLRNLVPDKGDLVHVCNMAIHDACHLTNPRPASAEDLMAICEEAW